MVRKLLMVGVIVLIGRGSVGQLVVALVLAAGFSMLHVRSWPYKQRADTVLKLAVELQILFTVMVGMAIKADPDADTTGYDILLVALFVINIPAAFTLAVVYKLCSARALINQTATSGIDRQRRRAYELHKAGMAGKPETKVLEEYLALLRVQGLGTIVAKIEGRSISARTELDDDQERTADGGTERASPAGCASPAPAFRWEILEEAPIPEQSSVSTAVPAGRPAPDVAAENADSGAAGGHEDAQVDDPFAKFSGGFDGTFADTTTFFGARVFWLHTRSHIQLTPASSV